MHVTRHFKDFTDWLECAKKLGYDGPHQVQGHLHYEFTQGGVAEAFWSETQGTVMLHEVDPVKVAVIAKTPKVAPAIVKKAKAKPSPKHRGR